MRTDKYSSILNNDVDFCLKIHIFLSKPISKINIFEILFENNLNCNLQTFKQKPTFKSVKEAN